MLIVIAVLIGAVLPVQTVVNTRLRSVMGSPLRSSFASFCIGTVALAIAVWVTKSGFSLTTRFIAAQPWWIWLGGACGVVFLTVNIVIFPRLGSVQTVVLPILGQILMADVIDTFGWFSSTARPWSWLLTVGTGLSIIGVLLAVAGRNLLAFVRGRMLLPNDARPIATVPSQPRTGGGSGRWLWQMAGVGIGALSAIQTTVNGALGVRLHTALGAALISFAVGTAVLAVLTVVTIIGAKGRSEHATVERKRAEVDGVVRIRTKSRWWYWIGGVLGAVFVYGNAMLAPILGTGLTVVLVLAGQLTGGLTVDNFGVLGTMRRPVTLIQLVGVVVLMAGAMMMRLA